MVYAGISEVEDGYIGQMHDEVTGQRFGQVFAARERGELIAKMKMWVPLTHLIFRDDTSGVF